MPRPLLYATAVAAIFAISTGHLTANAGAAVAAAPVKMAHTQAGYHYFLIGEVEVVALSDGTLPIPPRDLLTNVSKADISRRLDESFQKPDVDASVNAYLIKSGGRLILVDAGTGELYGPTLNKIGASLNAIGYQTSQISDILITHIHTDHTGGLMDGARLVFPNATVHVEKAELDFWMNPANRAKAVPFQKKYFDEAKMKMQASIDAGHVKTFHGATTLFPGIRSIPAPGHTPGHTLYALENKGEKLVFWGDLLHVAAVQLPDPAVTILFDVDPTMAAQTRFKALADAAKGRYWVAADHISFPGVGHVRADRKGYAWVPMNYINDFYPPAQK